MARRVHRRTSTRSSTTARRRCRSTTPIPSCTGRATSTARSSASRGAAPPRDQAWALVKYLTTNKHCARAVLSNGIRNVPTTSASLHSPGADAGRALRDVPEDLREPEVEHVADHGLRRRLHEPRSELLHEVAGGQREGSHRRAEEARHAARRPGRAGQGRRGAVSESAPASTAGASAPPCRCARRRRSDGAIGAAAGSCCS